MGMEAYLLVIGRFSSEISGCLQYPESYYSDTAVGSVVFSELFNCCTADASRKLAVAVGANSWDFNTHRIRSKNIDWAALEELHADDVPHLRRLMKARFAIFYMPNG